MEIKKVELENFRKHKNKSIKLADGGKTIIVGQNNVGKSSFIEAINNVVNKKQFQICDFFEEQKNFINFLHKYKELQELSVIEEWAPCIKIKIVFGVSNEDVETYAEVVSKLSDYILEDEFVYICEYSMKSKKQACHDYLLDNINELPDEEMIECILKDYYVRKEYLGNIEEVEEMPSILKLNDLIDLKLLDANLQVEGRSESQKKSKISDSMLELMQKIINANSGLKNSIDTSLKNTSEEIVHHYEEELSEQLIEVFKTFGFNNNQSGALKIDLKLTLDNIIQKNFKTLFCIGDNETTEQTYNLPDSYNGLGYNNLLYTLMEIYSFISNIEENKKPILLLSIEEPETHMHPEMELKFIERIDEIKNIFISIVDEEIRETVNNKLNNSLQILITTHSANIVTNTSEKNLVFLNINRAISYGDINIDEKFALQYLTTHVANALFSKKIILVEGDVERILVPEFIKKLEYSNELYSIVQVGGTYFESFKTLYEKIGASVLIITDLDLKDKEKDTETARNNSDWLSSIRSIHSDKYNQTSNTNFKKFFGQDISVMDIANGNHKSVGNTFIASQRILEYSSEEGTFLVGRTFEEQFILENQVFLHANFHEMDSIKNYNKYDNTIAIKEFSYGLYRYIDRNSKKTAFTFDILSKINIGESNIYIPNYIEEGIEWLMTQ